MSQPPVGPNDPGGYYPPQGGNNPGSSPLSNITVAGYGVLGAALLTLVASVLPWWSISYKAIGFDDSYSGWHRFWILVPLLALAIGVVYALAVFKVIPAQPQLPLFYVYGGLAAFVITLGALLDTFLLGSDDFAGLGGVSSGPSFGVFLALITTAALTYFGALAAQESGQKLPIKVPGLPVK